MERRDRPGFKIRSGLNNIMRNEYKALFEKYVAILEAGMGDSWTDTINGKEVTITLPEIIEYLKNVAPIDIPTKELTHLFVGAVEEPDEQHLKRINQSDLKYPIIVISKHGKYSMLLDGNHRLQKAIYNNMPTIKGKVLELDNAPEIYKQMFR